MQVSLRSSFGGKPENISVPSPRKPGRPRKSVASPAASAVGVLDEPLEEVITEVSDCLPYEIPIEALEGCPQMPRRQFPLALRLDVLQFIEAKLKEGLILEHIINSISRKVGIPLRTVKNGGSPAGMLSGTLSHNAVSLSGQWTRSESHLPKYPRITRISGGIRAKGGGPRTHSAPSTQSSINGF